MCGRSSNVLLRSIGLILLLSLLLLSPLYSASTWDALFGKGTTGSQSQASTEESYLESSETVSEVRSAESMEVSESDLKRLTELSIESMSETEKLQKSLADLKSDINTLQAVDAISEAEYDALSTTLNEALNANAMQADRIVELEKATKTRAYIMAGGDVGFENDIPTLGVNLSVGARIGNHFMIEAGAGYNLGGVSTLKANILNTSLDNFRFSARIGWMF